MTTQYPGAIWRPINYSGHDACDELTALTVHEAVTTAEQSVFGWVSSEGSCNWFNGKNGYAEQYIPAGIQSYANSSGNHRSFAMESYDGLKILQNPYREVGSGGIYGTEAQNGRWDDGQVERIADVFAWLNIEHGIPLRLMASSHTSEHGIGPHRLGVPGWPGGYDDLGGERWTSHPGKPCPGDLRIAQLPGIVARAQAIADAIQSGRCGYLPTGEVDVQAALARTGNTPLTPPAPLDLLEEIMSLDRNSDDYKNLVADISSAVAAQAIPVSTGGTQPLGSLLNSIRQLIGTTQAEVTRVRVGMQSKGALPKDSDLNALVNQK